LEVAKMGGEVLVEVVVVMAAVSVVALVAFYIGYQIGYSAGQQAGSGSSGDGNGGDGNGGCFAEGTPVLLADGARKAIEQVEAGDCVLSRHEGTGEIAEQPVMRKWIHQRKPTLTLRLSDGSAIETTRVHPFFVKGKGFVAAGALQPGLCLMTHAETPLAIVSIDRHAQASDVYNLAVANFHTYFVGDGAVWVHNKENEPGGGDGGSGDGDDGSKDSRKARRR
jgi:Pretoxin HINT domain